MKATMLVHALGHAELMDPYQGRAQSAPLLQVATLETRSNHGIHWH